MFHQQQPRAERNRPREVHATSNRRADIPGASGEMLARNLAFVGECFDARECLGWNGIDVERERQRQILRHRCALEHHRALADDAEAVE